MKFTKSVDGKERTSIRYEIRISKAHALAIRNHLKSRDEPYHDRAVRDFVRSCTEYHPASFIALKHSLVDESFTDADELGDFLEDRHNDGSEF